ncbi:MAG: hypothetical protein AB1894_26335 [Chloroflexota bacterium]
MPALTRLQNILVELYPEDNDVRRLATQAGVSIANIRLGGRSIDSWHSLLDQARLRNKLIQLFEIISSEYPESRALIEAIRVYEVDSVDDLAIEGTKTESPSINLQNDEAKWWQNRGYAPNPFQWYNAGEIPERNFRKLFDVWHVDPGGRRPEAAMYGLGDIPTFEKITTTDSSELIVVYAPPGGGKTFYSKWAARYLEGLGIKARTVNLAGQMPDPENITATDLAHCVYTNLYKIFASNVNAQSKISNDSIQDKIDTLEIAKRTLAILERQAAGYTSLAIPTHIQIELEDKRKEIFRLEDDLRHSTKPEQLTLYEPFSNKSPGRILKECNDLLETKLAKSDAHHRVYLFIDNIDSLFDDRETHKAQNMNTLASIVELCREIANRGGGDLFALRIFVPLQLMPAMQQYLGKRARSKIISHILQWRIEYCWAVVERRLSACWQRNPGSIKHISRLLSPDAVDELSGWFQSQQRVSPGCVIKVFDRLGKFARRNGATTEPIGSSTWKEFLESTSDEILCQPDEPFPL